MQLKDSGNRREFESGAVRDICEGKGRCDLLPLDIVSVIMENDLVLHYISLFIRQGDTTALYKVLELVVGEYGFWPTKEDMILEVAKHFEDGAGKYGERNWEKGIPLHCYIDSAVRHYIKHIRGDNDEPHDRAFAWNIMCALWTIRNRKNCIDIPSLTSWDSAKFSGENFVVKHDISDISEVET